MITKSFLIGFIAWCVLLRPPAADSQVLNSPTVAATEAEPSRAYMIGPEDVLSVKVVNVVEIGDAPYAVDLKGNLNLPIIGTVHAAGSTVDGTVRALGKIGKIFIFARSTGIMAERLGNGLQNRVQRFESA